MKGAFLLVLSIGFLQNFAFAQTQPVNLSFCPTISITGSSGITFPGDLWSFKADIKDFDISELKFEWAVTNGEIIKGQGTLSIDVKPIDACESVTATIKILGLPQTCTNEVTGSGYVACEATVTVIDEYGKITNSKEKGRFIKAPFNPYRIAARRRSRTYIFCLIQYRQGRD